MEYRYINSQKKDAQGIPPLKKRNGSGVAQSESEKAAEFNGQFTDVFTKSEYSQVPLLDRSAPFMEDIVVTKEVVTFERFEPLSSLRPKKKICVFPVTRPTLIFPSDPKVFIGIPKK